MYNTVSVLALASSASATILGFNYGSTFTTGAPKMQADFEAEFSTASQLQGAPGFTSARLYTMVQAGTASDPISAIPAAISTNTTLLLGLWASGGDTSFVNEVLALKAAIEQYGDAFTSNVDGISIGSEDLYRNSPQGIAAGSFVGAEPDTLVRYIKQTKDAIAGSSLEGVGIGHVDTWTAWYNQSNQAVVAACDWVGMDAYPYFQDTMPNAIGESKSLFEDALGKTQGASGGKPVWITETGHPVSGKTVGQSVASTDNAESYWKTVGCPMFGQMNVWWYTLQDASPDTPNPSFGIVGNKLSSTPLFDLSCENVEAPASSSAAANSSATALSTAESSGTPASSSSAATETAPESTENSGGSPGGVPSSQVSLQNSATVTPAIAPSQTVGGSGSGTSPSGSPALSSSSGPGSGAGSNATFTAPPSATSSITPPTGAAGVPSGGLGAAFVAIMVAIFAL